MSRRGLLALKSIRDRGQLARELISYNAARWKGSPDTFVSERTDGTPIFTFVFRSSSSETVIHYDPQDAAEAIIKRIDEEPRQKPLDWAARIVLADVAIFHLLTIARKSFEDGLWMLPLEAVTTSSLYGRARRRRAIDDLLDSISSRKKRRYDRRREGNGGRKPGSKLITPDDFKRRAPEAYRALFNETGEHPRDVDVAVELGISSATFHRRLNDCGWTMGKLRSAAMKNFDY
jgi:hypothetical protein